MVFLRWVFGVLRGSWAALAGAKPLIAVLNGVQRRFLPHGSGPKILTARFWYNFFSVKLVVDYREPKVIKS